MVRKYKIEWYAKKDRTKVTRHSWIQLSNPTGKVDVDAHSALELFIHYFGNLTKNEVVKIQEFDENGQIGEDITPAKEGIIPVGVKA